MTTRGIPLRFVSTDSGCYVPVNHRTNQDGYLRLSFKKRMLMFHRVLWEEKNGPIPEGYEVHHKCGVRCCCNTDHLELLEGTEHAVLTNKERYLDRKVSVIQDSNHMKPSELAVKYACSERTIYRHLRGKTNG